MIANYKTQCFIEDLKAEKEDLGCSMIQKFKIMNFYRFCDKRLTFLSCISQLVRRVLSYFLARILVLRALFALRGACGVLPILFATGVLVRDSTSMDLVSCNREILVEKLTRSRRVFLYASRLESVAATKTCSC